ncbi:Ceramide synthase 3 [Physocladia obscura]|uniref:Ceramide synthase 3 n=1 Tax=Physocladia obscura TaxID=109957 RepID=A0AAD5XG32_9FUNG|nr:Ceramide synthase 3 [Physocladia obscura]
MVFVKPVYVNWSADIWAVFAWTAGWALAHTVLHRALIVPLANAWFPVPVSISLSSASHKVSSTATTASPTSSTKLKQRKGKSTSAPPSHSHQPVSDVDVKAITNIKKKFVNSAWKFCVYTAPTIFGIVVFLEDDWWMNPKAWMLDIPDPTSHLMKIYYYIGFGNYTYQTLTLMSHPRQSDFWGVVLHHFTTVAVISASYICGFTRIGVIILLLHDCSDPFMEFAKCNMYLNHQKIADNMFTLFAIVFIVTRNVLFPYVIYSAHENSILEDGTRMPRGHGEWGLFCLGCLWILAILNFYWGYLVNNQYDSKKTKTEKTRQILKIAAQTFLKGENASDIREED